MSGSEGSFPLLTAPTVIGPVALRNRMVLCPMGDNLAEPGGSISDRQLGYYEARAAGGVGLLLVGSVGVAASGRTAAEQTGAHLDAQVDGLRRLADIVHGHGAAIAAQLVHCGPNAVLDYAEGRPVLVPSKPPRLQMDALSGMLTGDELTAMTEPFTRPGASMGHHVATEADLAEVVGWYAAAARRVREAGFDGIEVHAGHGYLVDAFLSPRTNQRTDGWGGDVAGRARLLLDVLAAVRAEAGPELAVWIRLNGCEVGKDDGETIDDAIAVARLAEAAGADAIHVTAYADPGQAIGITAAHTPHQPGARLADAAAIRAAVDVPVITYGRLEPAQAEAALADGTADLVAFGRKLLAGPDLPAATTAGRPADARPCAYQYRCIGNIFLHRPLACAVSPDTTREVELRIGRSSAPEHVLVVGGGPVGLEAAHRLATAGHRVTLWEAGDRLGGNLVVAGHADPALAPLRTWLARTAGAAGVDVHLGRRATAETVVALAPDRVVLATGATWQPPTGPTGDDLVVERGRDGSDGLAAVAGTDERQIDHDGRGGRSPGGVDDDRRGRAGPDVVADRVSSSRTDHRRGHTVPVLTPDDLRARRPDDPLGDLPASVVVLGSGKVAVSLAGAAARAGCTVALVAADAVLAPELGLPGRFRLVHELEAAGVALHVGAAVVEVNGTGVVLADGTTVATDLVLAATSRHAPTGLATELEATGLRVDVVGDATGTFGLESGLLAAARLATAPAT